MNKKLKSIPKFRSEAEERQFWETHDSSEYVDWSRAERGRFPNLKPSTTAISLRLPVALLERIKVAANKRDRFRHQPVFLRSIPIFSASQVLIRD
jgi:hypothetical protein